VLDPTDARAEAQAQHGESGEVDLGIAAALARDVFYGRRGRIKRPRAVGADEHLQLPESDPGVHRLRADRFATICGGGRLRYIRAALLIRPKC